MLDSLFPAFGFDLWSVFVRSPPGLRRTVRRVQIDDTESLPSQTRRAHQGRPSPLGDSPPVPPPINRVLFLIQGGRHGRNIGGFVGTEVAPYRKYVTEGLHKAHVLTDYLSVQAGTEKQVTPLFRQLTMLDMKGTRKASTPRQWRDDFISRVKAARIVSGKKPVEIAAALGVNLDTYNRWESRALLPHHLVMDFCKITGADPVMLLTGAPFDLGKALAQSARR